MIRITKTLLQKFGENTSCPGRLNTKIILIVFFLYLNYLTNATKLESDTKLLKKEYNSFSLLGSKIYKNKQTILPKKIKIEQPIYCIHYQCQYSSFNWTNICFYSTFILLYFLGYSTFNNLISFSSKTLLKQISIVFIWLVCKKMNPLYLFILTLNTHSWFLEYNSAWKL